MNLVGGLYTKGTDTQTAIRRAGDEDGYEDTPKDEDGSQELRFRFPHRLLD